MRPLTAVLGVFDILNTVIRIGSRESTKKGGNMVTHRIIAVIIIIFIIFRA